jgi:magnesium-transporting ATPase (P-type)
LISDATIGCLFQYTYLFFIEKLLSGGKYEFKSGNYVKNGEFSVKEYIYQMLVWFMIVLLSKMSSLAVVLIFFSAFQSLGIFLLQQFKGNPKLKLIFVMIVFPLIFNTLQFWITDNFIQEKVEVNIEMGVKDIKDQEIGESSNSKEEKEKVGKEDKEDKEDKEHLIKNTETKVNMDTEKID